MSDIAVNVDGLCKKYILGRSHSAMRGILSEYANKILGKEEKTTPCSGIWALQDVSFQIRKGEVFGVIGTNGSGKSTLLKILSRVTYPTKGRAIIHGRFCGLLEVGTGFHHELTGRDNIYMSGAILGMKRREIDRKFDEIVEFAEVEQFIDTPVKYYSSGMYVRLGFSVLAHMDPDILIVDEVLAVGDVRFQKKCMGKMEDVGQHGRTVILVSHDMSAITRLCKRALLLSHGEVAKEGPAYDVVNEYLYMGHIKPCREWPTLNQSPGDDVVRMRSVSIKTEDGMIMEGFDIRKPIAVEMVFDILKAGHSPVAQFSFHNEEDAMIFMVNDRDPEWYRRHRPPGRYVSTAWIPGNLMPEGIFTVGAGIMTEDPFRLHCDVPRVVGFRVNESTGGNTARGDFTGRWPGAVRPLLKWTTQHTLL